MELINQILHSINFTYKCHTHKRSKAISSIDVNQIITAFIVSRNSTRSCSYTAVIATFFLSLKCLVLS